MPGLDPQHQLSKHSWLHKTQCLVPLQDAQVLQLREWRECGTSGKFQKGDSGVAVRTAVLASHPRDMGEARVACV